MRLQDWPQDPDAPHAGTPRFPYVLIFRNTVELIPTLGALFPRGGPVQDPVFTLLRDWDTV